MVLPTGLPKAPLPAPLQDPDWDIIIYCKFAMRHYSIDDVLVRAPSVLERGAQLGLLLLADLQGTWGVARKPLPLLSLVMVTVLLLHPEKLCQEDTLEQMLRRGERREGGVKEQGKGLFFFFLEGGCGAYPGSGIIPGCVGGTHRMLQIEPGSA